MKAKIISLACIILICSVRISAQDSIAIKDAREIRYKSELLVKRELQDLLNNISQPGFDSKETEEIIHNSYAGSGNKIFDSEKARIESDLNPTIHGSAAASDIDVAKYLRDFDLLYTKSENFSVAFSDIKTSLVKKSAYMYVKVYFSSFFNNKYKGVEGETAYTLNNRVAEVKIVKAQDRWLPYITSIDFYQPADTLNDIANDMIVIKEGEQNTGAGIDSATAASIDAQIEARKKQQLIDEEIAEAKKFSDLLNEGDKALSKNSYTDAVNYYNQARELRPYDPLPRSKISKALKEKENMNITKDKLFDEYKDRARLAIRKREYEEAIRLYRTALDNKPTEKKNLQSEIDELTNKVNFLTEMNLNYKAGNYKEAIRQYSAAIKKKKDSDYFLGRARCYEKTGEYGDALNDYTVSYQLDNENLAAIEGRGDLHKFLGDAVIKSKKGDEKKEHYIKALTDYAAYLTISKENERIFEQSAAVQMLLYNNIDEAVKTLDAGITEHPKSETLYMKKGLLLMQKEDYRKAHINFSNAIQIDSNDAFAYYNRGICQLRFNAVDAAAQDFEAARKKGLDSTNRNNIASFGDKFFQKAENDLNAKGIDSAILMIDNAIAIEPSNSVYHFTRGEYYAGKKQYKEAIVSYDKAIARDNAYTDAYYKRGVAYYNLGDNKTALENLNSAAKAGYPDLYLVQQASGNAALAMDNDKLAVENFEKAIKTAGSLKKDVPDNIVAQLYNGLSRAYFNQNIYDKAIDAAKNAIKKNASFAEAYFNRGTAYNKSGKLKDAIDDLEKAVSLDTKRNDWKYQLARCRQTNGEQALAANIYTQVIAADTSGILQDAVYYRAEAYYESGDFSHALPDYIKSKTTGLDTVFSNLGCQLGNTYLNLGRYDSASTCYREILNKDTANAWALYGMGTCNFLKGNKGEALQWFERSFQTKLINSADIKKDRLIANLRNEKDFKALMKKYY
jgi:tetratricopeptide (TPR) repeat protein